MPDPIVLSTAHLTVLGLLDERPRHGFAIAKLLAPDGEVGRVWSVRPSLVYRTLGTVTDHGLAEVHAAESGGTGPRRTVYAITTQGRKHVWQWLVTPVEHVREVRTELMLKLALLDRLGADVRPLLRAQRAQFVPILEALGRRPPHEDGAMDGLLRRWRAESVTAAVRFIDGTLAASE